MEYTIHLVNPRSRKLASEIHALRLGHAYGQTEGRNTHVMIMECLNRREKDLADNDMSHAELRSVRLRLR